MKKTLFVLLLSGIVLGIGTLFFLETALSRSTRAFCSDLTLSKTTVRQADYQAMDGECVLFDVRIANPVASNLDPDSTQTQPLPALHAERVTMVVPPATLFYGNTKLTEFIVHNPAVLISSGNATAPLDKLIRNVKAALELDRHSTGWTALPWPHVDKVTIQKLYVTGGTVINQDKPDALPMRLPTIVLKDIGEQEGGLPPSQVFVQLLEAMDQASRNALFPAE